MIVVLEEGAARLYNFFSPCPAVEQHHTDRRGVNASYGATAGSTPTEVTASCYYTQYSLGTEAVETGVEDARIWAQGLVIRTRAGRYVEWTFPPKESCNEGAWSKRALSIPTPILLPPVPADLPSSSQRAAPQIATESNSQISVSSWDIIPSTVSNSGLVEVLLSPTSLAQQGTLLSLDSLSGSTDLRLTRGPFHAIRPSPNGALLALLTHDSKVWVVSSDLQRSLSEYDLGSSEAFEANRGNGLGGTGVEDVRWCGNNSVVLTSESEVVMVGPFGEVLR